MIFDNEYKNELKQGVKERSGKLVFQLPNDASDESILRMLARNNSGHNSQLVWVRMRYVTDFVCYK